VAAERAGRSFAKYDGQASSIDASPCSWRLSQVWTGFSGWCWMNPPSGRPVCRNGGTSISTSFGGRNDQSLELARRRPRRGRGRGGSLAAGGPVLRIGRHAYRVRRDRPGLGSSRTGHHYGHQRGQLLGSGADADQPAVGGEQRHEHIDALLRRQRHHTHR
jgi:hypothetical protein